MIRNIKLLLTTLMLLSGCVREVIEPVTENNGHSISFELSIPDATEMTRAMPTLTNESAIDNMYVFVFESGTGTLDHWVKAQITTSAGATTGTVTLGAVTNSAAQHTLVFLANVEDEILTAGGSSITSGMSYSAFESVLTTNINSILTTEPDHSFRFPMWGESGPVTISPSLDLTGSNAIRMQRSLAKIDVGVNLQSGTAMGLAEFKLTGVYVYQVNSSALVVPASANRGADGYVTAPTVSGIAMVNVERSMAAGEHGSLSSIYVPETNNNASVAGADRPYVIVKGIYLGINPANTTETYYRLEFVTGQDSDSPVDLMRNYSYTFNITAVNNAGYDTPENAKANPPAGLTYDFFPSTTSVQYKYFCYSDVGYLATQTDQVTITSHTANSSITQTFKAEYIGNTAPVLGVYMCDVNGDETTSSHFTVSILSTTVTARTIAANETYNPITEYFKVYLVDNPDICLISEVRHNVFSLANLSTRSVYYGRTASDTGWEGTLVTHTATYPHLPNNDEYFAIYWSGFSGFTLPASQFRITRGTPSDSFYRQVIVNHPTGGIGVSENFQMPAHSSPNYVSWNIEWWNPYENGGAGAWVEYANTFEQVGSNFRYPSPSSNIYFAVTDLEYGAGGGYSPGSGIFTGWNWTQAMGIASSYQTTAFSSTGGYTPTELTGCGAYWEGSQNDPVTGQGKWEIPSSGYMYNALTRTNYFNPGSYLGIPAGAVDVSSSTWYISSTNAATTFTANSISGTASTNITNTQKSAVNNFRVRCIRIVP